MKKCVKCGTVFFNNYSFCPECGTPAGKETIIGSGYQSENDRKNSLRQGNKSSKKGLLIAAVLLLLAGAGFAAARFLIPGQNNNAISQEEIKADIDYLKQFDFTTQEEVIESLSANNLEITDSSAHGVFALGETKHKDISRKSYYYFDNGVSISFTADPDLSPEKRNSLIKTLFSEYLKELENRSYEIEEINESLFTANKDDYYYFLSVSEYDPEDTDFTPSFLILADDLNITPVVDTLVEAECGDGNGNIWKVALTIADNEIHSYKLYQNDEESNSYRELLYAIISKEIEFNPPYSDPGYKVYSEQQFNELSAIINALGRAISKAGFDPFSYKLNYCPLVCLVSQEKINEISSYDNYLLLNNDPISYEPQDIFGPLDHLTLYLQGDTEGCMAEMANNGWRIIHEGETPYYRPSGTDSIHTYIFPPEDWSNSIIELSECSNYEFNRKTVDYFENYLESIGAVFVENNFIRKSKLVYEEGLYYHADCQDIYHSADGKYQITVSLECWDDELGGPGVSLRIDPIR